MTVTNVLRLAPRLQICKTIFTNRMLLRNCTLAAVVALAVGSPITSPSEGPADLAPRQAASLCGQFSYYAANGYEFNNNNWGEGAASSGSQCTTVQSTSDSGVSWSTAWNWQGGQNNVKSYAYVGKQFPRGLKINDIKSMPTSIQWSYQPINGIRADAAYDIFTAADPNHVTSSGDYEMMVW